MLLAQLLTPTLFINLWYFGQNLVEHHSLSQWGLTLFDLPNLVALAWSFLIGGPLFLIMQRIQIVTLARVLIAGTFLGCLPIWLLRADGGLVVTTSLPLALCVDVFVSLSCSYLYWAIGVGDMNEKQNGTGDPIDCKDKC